MLVVANGIDCTGLTANIKEPESCVHFPVLPNKCDEGPPIEIAELSGVCVPVIPDTVMEEAGPRFALGCSSSVISLSSPKME